MVGILIGLRSTIQRHTQGWKRHLGRVLGVAAAALTWVAVLVAAPAARPDVLALALAFWLVGWVVGPILSSGASVLRPEYFTLLPLDHRRLGLGLLATVFVGVGAAVTMLGLLAVAAYAAVVGPWWTVAVGALAGVLFAIGVVGLARAVYALLGAAMRSRFGVELAGIQYGALIASLFAGWLAVAPVVTVLPVFLNQGIGGTPSAVLGASPAGWPARAVDAAAAGDLLGALGWLALLAAFAGLATAAAVRLLTPYTGNRTTGRQRPPLASRVLAGRALLPLTPMGAVVGKELRTWSRDPWRSLEVRSAIWFGIFLTILLVGAGAGPWSAWAGVAVAIMVAMSGANLYGQDGTALWQLVVSQSPQAVRADVRGRQIAIVVALGLPVLALTAAIVALLSAWFLAAHLLAVIVALLGVGAGVSAFLSVVAATPGIDPAKRVNANDAGENGLAIQLALYSALLLAAPTIAAVVSHLVGGWGVGLGWAPWALVALAVVNGFAGAWLLGHVAVRTLTRRLPETFARLRYPGLKVASTSSDDRGVVGILARRSEKAAHEALEAAQKRRSAIGAPE